MTDLSGLAQQPFVRTFGQGPRRALAIHCTLAHSASWRGVAGQLQELATFTAFDMLSHGRSPDWDRDGDIHDRITEIGHCLFEDGMDLIGHSFGATVALRLAVEAPEKVRSLTLIEPVLVAALAQDMPQELHALQAAERETVMGLLEAGDDEEGARAFNRMWGDGKTRWADMSETTRAAMVRAIHIVPASQAAVHEDRAGLLRPGRLEAITAPTVLLRGSDTKEVIASVNEVLAGRLPNAQSRVVEGAGHMLTMTHATDVASHIRDLFQNS